MQNSARPLRVALFLLFLAGLACAGPLAPTATAPSATDLPATRESGPTDEPPAPTALAPTDESTLTDAVRLTTEELLDSLGAEPCPDSDFTCGTLTLPLDHFDPGRGTALEVVFGVLPATGERRGMFVTATGGPGYAGLASADSYTSAFDPGITEHYDIVFFNQRGLGEADGVQCPNAAAAFYQADWQTQTPEQREAFSLSAEAMARDCVAQMGPDAAALLPYLGTAQAVEDLEAFRELMGDEQFWLYGESYGTQFAQTYAAAHPDRLAGLILDGTVDLTLTGAQFYEQQARAFADVLAQTLTACDDMPDCADEFAAMGAGSAAEAYDALAARLAQGPLVFNFPVASGESAERSLSLSDLETAAAGYVYSEDYRMQFVRALATAARGDLSLLARQVYSSLGLDPETLEPYLDPTYSDAVYYAVECQDYAYPGGTPAERAANYFADGEAFLASSPRMASIYFGDLPCAFWPGAATDPTRPAPLAAAGIPTLVLGATADPATPVGNGEAVFSRLEDGYLITMGGGPHVIFGRGNACPDDLVTAFLLDGEVPAERETICDGYVMDDYYILSPVAAADFRDALDAMWAFDIEVYYLPEYYDWDYYTPTAVGCTYGGGLSFEPSDTGHVFAIEGCAFTQGFVLTGVGAYEDESGTLTFDVTVAGDAEGELHYEYLDDGTINVTGNYAGEEVDLTQTP